MTPALAVRRAALAAPAVLCSSSPLCSPALPTGFSGPNRKWGSHFAFIGLGRMGLPMARNLLASLESDDTIRVFDINSAASASLVAFLAESRKGPAPTLEVSASTADAIEYTDTVITVLPEQAHVASVVSSVMQAEFAPRPTRLFIDCSTIDPAASRSLAAALAASPHGRLVDAPMSGGVAGAQAGHLTFMVGGPDDLADRASHTLRRLGGGTRVLRCGDAGSGLVVKLANNYILAAANAAVAEAMNMGVRAGVDPHALAAVINASTGRCWSSEVNNPVPGVCPTAPASRAYAPGFTIQLMRKDLGLAVATARQAGARLELADALEALYRAVAADSRCAGLDFSAVYRFLDETSLPQKPAFPSPGSAGNVEQGRTPGTGGEKGEEG